MIKFSRDLVDTYFASHYRRGCVLRFNMKCDDPDRVQRFKFGIVLNKDWSEPEVLLAITTTKIEWFSSGHFDRDIVRLHPGIYPWVTSETVVDLRSIRSELVDDLKTLCERQDMSFEQELGEPTIAELDEKLRASRLIELRIKKRII